MIVLAARLGHVRGLGLLLALLLPARSHGSDIVLGMSAAFKGPSRALGIELYRGSMAYFEHVNRSGGIQGRKIIIKAYNDSYDPVLTINNTIRLLEQDDPLLLYGYVGTPTVTRALPLLKIYSNRSPYLFFPFTGAQPHRKPPYDDFVFNLRASYREETAGLVDNFVAVGRTRIAVFYQIDSYGRDGWDGVRKALARHERRLVGEATYRRGAQYTESFRPQVDILREAAPDAVICVGAYAACAGFIRDARDAGWDVPIANISFASSDNLLALLRDSEKAAGKPYTSNLISSQVVPSYHHTDLEAARQYCELMDRYRPMCPADLLDEPYQPLPYSYVGFEGYLNARLLVEILKKMGKTIAKDRLRETVEAITTPLDLGIDVPITFGRQKHQGLNRVYYTTVTEGRLVPIADLKRWRK